MAKQNICKRIELAGTEGCRIVYCDDCKIAELEFGAISLRLELSAVYNLQSLLNTATRKLTILQSLPKNHAVHLNHSDLH